MPNAKTMVAGTDGWTDWIQPRHERYLLKCCDCGSTHVIEFRVVADTPGPMVETEDVVPGLVVFRARRPRR